MAEDSEESSERDIVIEKDGTFKIKETEKKEKGGEFRGGLHLFLIGTLWWLAMQGFFYFSVPNVPQEYQLFIGVAFMLGTSALVFKWKGFVANLVIVVFFFIFEKRITKWFIVLSIATIIVYIILWYGFRKKGIREGIEDELLGIIPLGVFLLDALHITNFLSLAPENMILTILNTIPLWGFLGAVFGLAEQKDKFSKWEVFLRFLAVITPIVFIFLVIPAALGQAGEYELIDFSVDETLEELPKEKPLIYYTGICTAKVISHEVTDVDSCVKELRAKDICEQRYPTDEGSRKDCVDEALGLKEDVRSTGGVDPQQREPTELSIKQGEIFPKTIAPDQSMEFILTFKNPRKQKVRGKAYCEVKDSKIIGNTETFELTEEIEEVEFTCEPTVKWPKGRLNLEVNFVVEGLETSMWLHRVYVGEQTEENKERNEKLAREWAANALGPNDPVWLDFSIGKNVLIDDNQPRISAWVKNRQNGKIGRVFGSAIRLPDFPEDITLVESSSCKLQKLGDSLINPSFNPLALDKNKEFQYGSCKTILNEELRNPKNPTTAYYTSFIKYDYEITEKFSVTVVDNSITESVRTEPIVEP